MTLNIAIPLEEKTKFVGPAKFIGNLPSYQYYTDLSTPVQVVVENLKNTPELPGLLLRRDSVYIGVLSRLKIFEWLGRPFGVELFFKKPISHLSTELDLSGEIYPHDMPISTAIQKALTRSVELMYEPIVVSFGGDDLRLLDMNVLLLAQSAQLTNANVVIEKQVEIGKVLSSSLELPKVLPLILEQMDSIIPYSRAAILLYRNNQMEFAASRGYPENVNMDEARVLVNDNGVFNQIIQLRQITTVDDVSSRDDWQHIPNTPQTRSWLGVPLVHNDEVLGMLSISRLEIAPFTPDQVETSASFAGQAAVALGNAKLYERNQLFTHELEMRVQERTQELQKAYHKLEILDKNKSDFIKISSHEIKTPMTVVTGYAQMLHHNKSLAPEDREIVKSLNEGMKRLVGVVNTMLDVARLDTKEMQLDFRKMDMHDLITDIIDELAPSMLERQISYKIKNLDEMPKFRGDRDALKKAFYHVIVNAIKYTPDLGKIRITGNMPGMRDSKVIESSLQITVSDTGIGIDPAEHELIFDRFYQTGKVMLHSSGKTKFKGGGSGLGLAVARGIIDAHGGQIWVESSGQDEAALPGSSFHVILPIREKDKE